MSIVPGRDVPKVPQEWVDAVNKAVNDANHGVLAPLIRQAPAASLESVLAEQLAATVKDLQAYIEARADEIAGPLITATQKRAADEIETVRAAAARQQQRHEDLERELRRQLDAVVKSRDREFDELKRAHARLHEVRVLRVWHNEDGKGFVFSDDLRAALDGEEGN